jgi:valyl-tRNA synthetase
MIMLGIENTGKIPFYTVYLHGLVRDERGEKMSKTKGNVLSPIDLIEKYGADALRFALATGSSPGNDMKLSEQKVEAARNFANKVWNAGRFIIMNLGHHQIKEIVDPGHPGLTLSDRWILSRHNRLIDDTTRLLHAYQFGEAGRQIWEFLWGDFCDWYIEIAKVQLAKEQWSDITASVLVSVLERTLRLLHPFMPFLTEELWQYLPHSGDSIMIAPWPEPGSEDRDAEERFGLVRDLIHGIREVRSQFRVDPARWVEAHVAAGDLATLVESQRDIVSRLARVDPAKLCIAEDLPAPAQAATLVVRDVKAYLPLGAMLDIEQELDRLDRELQAVIRELDRVKELLSRESFLKKAPAPVVERERDRLRALEAERMALEGRKRLLEGK